MKKSSKEPLMISVNLKLLLFTGEKSFKDKTKSNTLEMLARSARKKNTKKMLKMKRNLLRMRKVNLKVMMLLRRQI